MGVCSPKVYLGSLILQVLHVVKCRKYISVAAAPTPPSPSSPSICSFLQEMRHMFVLVIFVHALGVERQQIGLKMFKISPFEGVLSSVALGDVLQKDFSTPNKPCEVKWKSFFCHPKTSISCLASCRRDKKKPAHPSQTKARHQRNWRVPAFLPVVLTLAESRLRGNECNIRVTARRQMMAFPLLSLLSPQSTSTSRGSRHPTTAWSRRTWTRSCWTRRWSLWIRTLRSPTPVGNKRVHAATCQT